MWIDTSIVVGSQVVELSVERLEPEAGERTAAAIAWFSLLAMNGDAGAEPAQWRTFMETTVFQHVRFTIPEEQLEALGREWWNQASGRAIVELVRINGLAPAFKRHLCAIERCGVTGALGVTRSR